MISKSLSGDRGRYGSNQSRSVSGPPVFLFVHIPNVASTYPQMVPFKRTIARRLVMRYQQPQRRAAEDSFSLLWSTDQAQSLLAQFSFPSTQKMVAQIRTKLRPGQLLQMEFEHVKSNDNCL